MREFNPNFSKFSFGNYDVSLLTNGRSRSNLKCPLCINTETEKKRSYDLKELKTAVWIKHNESRVT